MYFEICKLVIVSLGLRSEKVIKTIEVMYQQQHESFLSLMLAFAFRMRIRLFVI